MEIFLEYLTLKAPAIIIGTTNCAFAFGMINVLCLVALKKKTSMSRVVLTALCISLAFNLSLFVADCLLFFPQTMVLSNMLSLLVLPPPFIILLYYYLFRRLLGLSRAHVLSVLEPVMLAQYMVMLMFLSTSSLMAQILHIQPAWTQPINSELLSMLTTDIVVLCVFFFIKGFIKRPENSLEIPYGYPIPDTRKELLRVFLSVSCFYILLVGLRAFVLIPTSPNSNFLQATLNYILLAMLFYRFFQIIQRHRLSIFQWQAKTTDEYIRSLISANEEFRSLKHDFFNILQVYGGYITTQDLDGLKKYHNSTVKTATGVGVALDIIDPLRPRKAIYILFCQKAQLAKENNIDMKILQPSSLIKVALNDLELCRILGNLIDNAIDAAAESDEKKVIIACHTTSKDMVHIRITNSTAEELDLDLMDHKASTKPNHMGQGLTTVRNIISSHDRCYLRFTTKEGGIEDSIQSNIEGNILSANLYLVAAA